MRHSTKIRGANWHVQGWLDPLIPSAFESEQTLKAGFPQPSLHAHHAPSTPTASRFQKLSLGT